MASRPKPFGDNDLRPTPSSHELVPIPHCPPSGPPVVLIYLHPPENMQNPNRSGKRLAIAVLRQHRNTRQKAPRSLCNAVVQTASGYTRISLHRVRRPPRASQGTLQASALRMSWKPLIRQAGSAGSLCGFTCRWQGTAVSSQSRWRESNSQLADYKSAALPVELQRRSRHGYHPLQHPECCSRRATS